MFYSHFRFKSSQTPLTSVADFSTAPNGTEFEKNTGDVFKKDTNGVYTKVIRVLQSKVENDIRYGQLDYTNFWTQHNEFSSSLTSTGINLFTGPNTFENGLMTITSDLQSGGVNTFDGMNTFTGVVHLNGSVTSTATNSFTGLNTFNAGVTFGTNADITSNGTNTFNGTNVFNNGVSFNSSVTSGGHQRPIVSGIYDLGSSTKLWKDGWFSGAVDAGVIASDKHYVNAGSLAGLNETGGNSFSYYFDSGSSVWRTFGWNNTHNAFVFEDDTGVNRTLVHSGVIGQQNVAFAVDATNATTALTCTGNSVTATNATNAYACSGNSASADTALACTGRSLVATTADNCTGNSVTATNADRAATTTQIDITRNDANNTVYYIPYSLKGVNGATTAQTIRNAIGLSFKPSTNTLTVANLSGNASSASTAAACTGNSLTSSSCTGNSLTASSCTGNSVTATTADIALDCTGNSATTTLTLVTRDDAPGIGTAKFLTYTDLDGKNGGSTNQSLRQDVGLSYDPQNNILSCTTFNGKANDSISADVSLACSGTAVHALAADTALSADACIGNSDTATRPFITREDSSLSVYNIVFGTTAPGNTISQPHGLLQSNKLTYQSNTGTLSTAHFNGLATNATTAAACTGNSLTASSCTGNANSSTLSNIVREDSNGSIYNVAFSSSANVNGGNADQRLKQSSGLTFQSSTGTLAATIFNGTATSARYADLAEKYISDKVYPTGTVVEVGGIKEITEFNGGALAGVISDRPGLMLNSDSEGQYVALKGKVPVKCIGDVKKGQYCVAAHSGKVKGCNKSDVRFILDIVGIALEDSLNGEVMVKV